MLDSALHTPSLHTTVHTESRPPAGDADHADDDGRPCPVQQPGLWQDATWTARIIKSEDGDGWAVAMTLRGEAEPALVGPWTLGRDKKNPKPLDAPAFFTLVKAANEVLRRHQQQRQAQLHRSVKVQADTGSYRVALDIVPDDDAYALLTAVDADGQTLARLRVAPDFKLNAASALAWVNSGFCPPD